MKILLIEDSKEIIEIISMLLKLSWPETRLTTTRSGEEGIRLLESDTPDIVVLDLGLPDIDGLDVLKQIRLFSTVPVIILTVRSQETDVIKGLELGADEYITKPFRKLELLARIRALTRRHSLPGQQSTHTFGRFRLIYDLRKVFVDGREYQLTKTESTILFTLLQNAGRVVSNTALSVAIWGDNYPGSGDILKVHIHRLRSKLESQPHDPEVILTKPGFGYMIKIS